MLERIRREASRVKIGLERTQKEHRCMKNKERNYQESVWYIFVYPPQIKKP